MKNINSKTSRIEFKHANDKFDMEAAKELGINAPNDNVETIKILYAYELGLNHRL